jgi:hypothetical protein
VVGKNSKKSTASQTNCFKVSRRSSLEIWTGILADLFAAFNFSHRFLTVINKALSCTDILTNSHKILQRYLYMRWSSKRFNGIYQQPAFRKNKENYFQKYTSCYPSGSWAFRKQTKSYQILPLPAKSRRNREGPFP